jgi:hypothetical protein
MHDLETGGRRVCSKLRQGKKGKTEMSSVDWNALCNLAIAALMCGLSFRFLVRPNVSARLVPVMVRRRRSRATLPTDR